MPEDDIGLKVRIETEADASGVEETKAALGGLSTGVSSTRSSLREASMAGHEFRMIMGGIETASQGGARSISGATMAVRGLILALRTSMGTTGIVGIAAIGLGLLGGAFMALKKSGEAAGEGGEAAGEGLDKAKVASDEAKASLEKLTKEALEAVNFQLTEIDKNAAKATTRLKELSAEADKLAKDQLAHDIAKLKGQEGLSPAEIERREFALKKGVEQGEFKRSGDVRDAELADLRKQTTEAARVVQDQVKQRREVDDELRARKSDRDTLADELAKVKESLAFSRAFPTPGGGGPEEAKARRALEDQEKHLTYRQKENEEDIKTLSKRSAVFTAAINELGKKASETAEKTSPEIERLKQEKKDAIADFATKQSTEAMEFNNKQKEDITKLQKEDDQLKREYAEAKQRAKEAETPDKEGRVKTDTATRDHERMTEIEKRRAEIAKEEGERAKPVVQAQADNTVALKDVTAAIKDLAGELKSFNARKPGEDSSGGVITTASGEKIHVGAGQGLSGAGSIKRNGETIEVPIGDPHAVKDALKASADAQKETHDVIISHAEVSAGNDRKLASQLRNLRDQTPLAP